MSGRHSGMGLEERDGVALAVEEINRRGGVNGRKLSVVYEDDRNDPETARKIISRFIEDEVDVIIGHMTSVMTLSTVDLLEGTDIAMISPSTSTELLNGKDDNFFRLVEYSGAQASRLADYVAGTMMLTRMSTIYDITNRAFSYGWINVMESTFRDRGGRILNSIPYNLEEGDRFADLAMELLTGDPEVIAIAAGSIDAALICQQIRRHNDSVQFLMSGWSQTEDMITHGGAAVEGTLFSDTFFPESREPDFLRFRESFLDRYSYEPGFQGVNSYDCVLLIQKAQENRGKGESFKDSLRRIRSLKGLQGEILIDEFGDVKKQDVITSVQDGSLTHKAR